MEKNVNVTDVNGNQIGSTYPKRAKGLVKNGRAEYVGDHEIRLLFTQAPAVHNNTEELNMSKVINFNARDFRFDNTCGHNIGERAFMTTALGNAEVWEIGNWGWDWTQLICVKKLEKNTDYVLRFAMTGGYNDTDDAVSQAHIYPVSDYATREQAWEDRISFALSKSRFEPIISKRDKTGLLRVYELPFNTGEHEEWGVILVAQHAVARFFAAQDNSAYDKLEDLTYDQWWEERKAYLSGTSMAARLIHNQAQMNYNNFARSNGRNSTFENTEMTEKAFEKMLEDMDDGCVMNFNSFTVNYSSDMYNEDIATGGADGCVISLDNCEMTARAIFMIAVKIGDGCFVSLNNVQVSDEGLGCVGGFSSNCDGTNISLDNVKLPQKLLDMFYEIMGDGSNVSVSNVTTF